MSERLTAAVLAAVTAELLLATPVAAGTLIYHDGVLRYRDQPGHSGQVSIDGVRPAKADGTPGRLRGSASAPLAIGPGCRAAPSEDSERDGFLCVLTTPGLPRYRLSLGDRADKADITGDGPLRGVVYSGPGSDRVHGGAWRVYGGTGDDWIGGLRVYGGSGDDEVEDGLLSEVGRRRSVLRGGPGDDDVDVDSGPAWAYGGPGNDDLVPSPRRDMLVGGPGFDEIVMITEGPGPDRSRDVFRIRDGGRDYVDCLGKSDHRDVFFADRSDVFWETFSEDVLFNNRCRDSRVLFTGRPRIFP